MSLKVFIIIQACCFSVAFASAVFVLMTRADGAIFARHIRTIEGDTFVADVIYPRGETFENIKILLVNIDTPEMNDERADIRDLATRAKLFAEGRLSNAHEITLLDVRRGKYFRIIARVLVDGCDLGEELVREGLAERK